MRKPLNVVTVLLAVATAFLLGMVVARRELPEPITISPLKVIGYDSPQLRLFLYANAPTVTFDDKWVSADPPEGILRHCPRGQNP